jgi:DNA-binding transcriptional MerR regulator
MTTDERARYLLVGDVARRADRSAAAVNLWVKNGDLKPSATTPGGVRLFDERQVEEFLRRRRHRQRNVRRQADDGPEDASQEAPV